MKKARDEMGLKNVGSRCRSSARWMRSRGSSSMMNGVGLFRGNPDFKLYLMAEVPVIVFMAEEFAEVLRWVLHRLGTT